MTSNWYDIVLCDIGLRKSCIVRLRNGLRFYHANEFFPLEVFADEPYVCLDVKGRDVVDIGAYNGDSAIYFAGRDAKRVIAFEPNPQLFEIARKNLELNGCSNVVIFNKAVNDKHGHTTVSIESSPTMGWQLLQSAEGKRIEITTLQEICEQNNFADARLKIDCEGYEFPIILGSDSATLSKFGEICMEYHSDPKPIHEHLARMGFEIQYFSTKKRAGLGILLARLSRELHQH